MSHIISSVRVVGGSAVGSGARGWWVRPSGRALSGSVVVAWFMSSSAAGAFARRWAVRLGLPVFVRRRGGPGWLVSVPVGVQRG